MRNYFIAFLSGLMIVIAGSAIADIPSLPTRTPRSTDVVRLTDAQGNNYGLNWYEFLSQATTNVNWTTGARDLSTSTGRINWYSPNIYLGQ